MVASPRSPTLVLAVHPETLRKEGTKRLWMPGTGGPLPLSSRRPGAGPGPGGALGWVSRPEAYLNRVV